MKLSKLSTRQNISTVIWVMLLAFKFNKVTYPLLIISTVIRDNVLVLTTYLSALLIEQLTSGVNTFNNDILILLLLLFISGFVSNYIYDTSRYLSTRLNQTWELKAWEIFLNKTSQLDFQHLENPEYSLLMHKVKEAVNWRAANIVQEIPEIFSGIIGIVLTIGIFFSLNPIFILLILLPETIRFFINKRYGFALFSIWDSHGEAKTHALYAQQSLEKDDVLREAKIYSFTGTILSRYTNEIGTYMKESIKKLNERYSLTALTTLFDILVLTVIQIWLLTQVFAKFINIGAYTFYLANINTASSAFNRVQITTSYLFEQLPYISDLRKYLELEDLIIKPTNPIKVEYRSPKIEFRNVSFTYPGEKKAVLENINFTINPGEKVALVGENGAGKTTIIKLLARFYDSTEGEILVNDINIKDVDITSYYKLWGVLFQSFAKLWFSVRENIGMGNVEDIDNIDLIKEAARKADAEGFINKLPLGYETLLSKDFKNGTSLSGGQWQKLGIARALFANPKLVVLDEPTSALDAIAEAEVFQNINEISKDSTIVLISHRFATVRMANRIIVLKNGRVLEQGTHDELIKNSQLYSQMFNEQAKGYK